MRATTPKRHDQTTIDTHLHELRAQIDTTCLRTRATLDAQHAAVDAEVAAIMACVRRLQVYLDGRGALPARRPFP